MTVISFPDKPAPLPEPDEVRQLRAMLDSEDIRLLLGDLFLRVAASQPAASETPYTDALRRLLDGMEPLCDKPLHILMDNLDFLRKYDLLTRQRENLRRMLAETGHGHDMIREWENWKKDFEQRKKQSLQRAGMKSAKCEASLPGC